MICTWCNVPLSPTIVNFIEMFSHLIFIVTYLFCKTSMVKITRSFTIDIEKDGQKITIRPDEIQEIKSALEAALREKGREIRADAKPSSSKLHIREEKRDEIMNHVGKKLSSKPQTLSSLLDGISYVPNTLPFIRKMVEDRKDIGKKMIGKRMFYFRKS